jgi:molybdate transport system substrate-binding protein
VKARRNLSTIAIAVTVAAIASFSLGLSQTKPQAVIRVLSSNGVKAAVEELQAGAERAIGRPLAIEFNTTASLRQRIEAGQAFDVALLTRDAIDALIESGKIARTSRTTLARSGVGVGYRSGAAKPDVRTSSALKQALLRAQSVAYTRDGASRATIDVMLDRMGIARELESKTLFEPAGQSPLRVAEGKAELVLTLISEILPVRGVELAGPLPSEFQNYVAFEAALAASTKNTDTSKMLIQFLTTASAAQVFKAKGMEVGK